MKARNYAYLLMIIFLVSVCSFALNHLGVDKQNIIMIFMVGVLLVSAITRGYRFGIIASLLSVMIFNYFFTEPFHTMAISSPNDILLLTFFFIASVIASSLTSRFQKQLLISQKNERTARILFDVAQRLRNYSGEENISRQGIQCIKEYTCFDCIVKIFAGNTSYYSENLPDEKAGDHAEFPIMGIANKLGVLKIINVNKEKLDMEREWLFNTVAAQIGIALDREYAYTEREKIRIAMEKEHLKSDLLRSVSHDLRTPLTGIAAASSYLAQKNDILERERIGQLAVDINEQAEWLTKMVENIMNMTRIDSGKLEIKKQIEVAEDVINEAVSHVIGLSGRKFRINVPNELVAVPMDGKMITQVLINLLDNAVKHTSAEAPIELSVKKNETGVKFSVDDGGPGIDAQIEDSIFRTFVTSGKTSSDGKKGIGLGLAICKAIVESHGGSIDLKKSHLGGARFSFVLPAGENGKAGSER